MVLTQQDKGRSVRALLYTSGSPFARAVRVVLDELGLDYERREENFTPAVQERAKDTPTLQVPTFWDGDLVLWEGGLIVEYLLSEYPHRTDATPSLARQVARPDRHWNDKRIYMTVQNLGTTITTISQLTWTGVRHRDNEFLTRCAERYLTLLTWLEGQLVNDGEGFFESELSAQDIFLTCYLGFVANRPLDLDATLDSYPRIAALVKRTESRTSFTANPIAWWDPDVVGYAEDEVTPLYKS